jgi:hypothetical protein
LLRVRCTIEFIAAFSSSVVELLPIVLPFISPPRANHLSSHATPADALRADQPPRSRNSHMIRRSLIQPDAQKLPQRQRVGHPPRQRTPECRVIEPPAAAFSEAVESLLIEDPIQPIRRGMPRRIWQLI